MPDRTTRETAAQIDSTAADWAARMDRGALSADEDRALDDWLNGDERRAGAFARARAVAMMTDKARALGAGYDPDAFQQNEAEYPGSSVLRRQKTPAVTRRQMLWGSTAAGLTAAAAAGYAVASHGKDYSTQLGEMKVVPLSDGSVVSLNTASRLRVVFTGGERSVHLVAGEALFDVAKDARRPFVVHAGDTRVRAIGTSFVVQKLDDVPVQVLVREGVVEVARGGEPVRLSAFMRTAAPVMPATEKASSVAAVDARVVPVAMPPAAAERAMAWREGRIAFEGETLGEAVTEFHRYSDIRIVIDDPSIAREQITGLFQVNDPVSFARAVAASFNLHADVSEKQVRLHR